MCNNFRRNLKLLSMKQKWFFSVASKKSSSSGQSGGAMVANKDEAQGNVTTNAKGRCSNNILIYEFIR